MKSLSPIRLLVQTKHENKECTTYMDVFFLASLLFMAARQKILTKDHVYSPFTVFIEKLEAKLSCYFLVALNISLVNVARLLGGKRLEMNVCKQATSMLRVDNRVSVVPCGKSRGRKTCRVK